MCSQNATVISVAVTCAGFSFGQNDFTFILFSGRSGPGRAFLKKNKKMSAARWRVVSSFLRFLMQCYGSGGSSLIFLMAWRVVHGSFGYFLTACHGGVGWFEKIESGKND